MMAADGDEAGRLGGHEQGGGGGGVDGLCFDECGLHGSASAATAGLFRHGG